MRNGSAIKIEWPSSILSPPFCLWGKPDKAGTSTHSLLEKNAVPTELRVKMKCDSISASLTVLIGMILKYELRTRPHVGICHLTSCVCQNNTEGPSHWACSSPNWSPGRKLSPGSRGARGKGEFCCPPTHTSTHKPPWLKTSHGFLLFLAWFDFLSCPKSP